MSSTTHASLPRSPRHVTLKWLTATLRDHGALPSGRVATITFETRPKWNHAQTASLKITYEDDTEGRAPRHLFVKTAEFQDPLVDIFPGEIAFYADAPSEGLPLATCYGAFRDEASGRTCVLLEDLSETHEETPWPLPPTLPRCEDAVKALARLHAHWWGSSERPDVADRLQRKEERLAAYMDSLLPAFFDDLDDRLAPDRKRLLQAVCDRLPELKTRRHAGGRPVTRAHGDAHVWNVLYPKAASRDGCVFIDWEDWCIDMAAADLALMIALHWYPDRRARHEEALLRTYLEALQPQIEGPYGWDDLSADYRLGHLQNVVVPIYQQRMGHDHASWWSHLERWFLAYDDLGCAEVL